jgi:hypothetical protein
MIEITVTYDAGYLAEKMPQMIKNLIKDYTIETGKEIKNNIYGGKVTPNITETTKAIRRKRGQLGSPPLLASGSLLKSIRVKEFKHGAKITMNFYGALHNKGYNTAPNSMIPRKKVPKREFIVPKKGTFKRLARVFGKMIGYQFINYDLRFK